MRLFVAKEFKEYEEDEEMKDVVDGILEANEDEELKELEFQKKVEHACQLEAIYLATQKGEQKGQNQIIATLYKKGKSKEEIAELTDIPIKEIEKALIQ
ncbi:hypothetical protein HDR67_03770 [bacterium]|nr:hypothetical protein [bacterium]